ncbi:MAG: alpha-ketoglutarate-dependent dioxygenase AlkB [Pseudomonadota bacterium]
MAPSGFVHRSGALDLEAQAALLSEIETILAEAPLYTPTMPKTGRPLSVRMSNAGTLGWLTDQTGGYRYEPHHPVTGKPWPPIPDVLLELWREIQPDAAPPEACLINVYDAKAKLGLHKDADEDDQETGVLSISLGDTAMFQIGGLTRKDAVETIELASGDIVLLGGASRSAYHGVRRIVPGTSPLAALDGRVNLTLRRVSTI